MSAKAFILKKPDQRKLRKARTLILEVLESYPVLTGPLANMDDEARRAMNALCDARSQCDRLVPHEMLKGAAASKTP
ncbi:MAG: hypothetical protein JWO08_1171 [Verrucomicrobiaceae bacterium]|nr:hypothetical protein [Verrucomicrobiaceae bacterium]